MTDLTATREYLAGPALLKWPTRWSDGTGGRGTYQGFGREWWRSADDVLSTWEGAGIVLEAMEAQDYLWEAASVWGQFQWDQNCRETDQYWATFRHKNEDGEAGVAYANTFPDAVALAAASALKGAE